MIKNKGDEPFDVKNGKVPKVNGFIDKLDHGLEDFELFWNFVEEFIKVIVFYFDEEGGVEFFAISDIIFQERNDVDIKLSESLNCQA